MTDIDSKSSHGTDPVNQIDNKSNHSFQPHEQAHDNQILMQQYGNNTSNDVQSPKTNQVSTETVQNDRQGYPAPDSILSYSNANLQVQFSSLNMNLTQPNMQTEFLNNPNSSFKSIDPAPPTIQYPQPNQQPPPELQSNSMNQTNSQPTSTGIQMESSQAQNVIDTSKASQPGPSTKAVVTQTINLSNEMNLLEWFRTTDIINQIAEKAKHSVDSVITTLDPGMKEYLFSGGNINIAVLTDHRSHISSIRDAFLTVFGRATVGPITLHVEHPVKVALGYKGALEVANQRIQKLRQDKTKFPQNQVVLVIQPTLVRYDDNYLDNFSGDSSIRSNNDNSTTNLNQVRQDNWFFTYASILDDPVLGVTLNTFSQLIAIDGETIITLRNDKSIEDIERDLGFGKSLDGIMNSELKLLPIEPEDQTSWLKVWAGVEDKTIIHDTTISLANTYKRKWNANNIVN